MPLRHYFKVYCMWTCVPFLDKTMCSLHLKEKILFSCLWSYLQLTTKTMVVQNNTVLKRTDLELVSKTRFLSSTPVFRIAGAFRNVENNMSD